AVLGLRIQQARAEADDLLGAAEHGQHDPVAKEVVARSAFAAPDQAELLRQRERHLLAVEVVLQPIPAVRGVADAEACEDLRAHAAIAEVRPRARATRGVELRAVERARDLVDAQEPLALALRRGRRLRLLGAPRLGQLDAGAP